MCLEDKLTFILLDSKRLAGDVNVFFGEAGQSVHVHGVVGLRRWRDRGAFKAHLKDLRRSDTGHGGREGVPSQGHCPGSFAAHAGENSTLRLFK